jgi:hypothetical protein
MGNSNLALELLKGESGFNNIKSMLIHLDELETIFVLVNREYCIAYINEAACRILDTDYHQAIGKNWCENFVPPHYRDEIRICFDELMNGNITEFDTYVNPVLSSSENIVNVRWDNSLVKMKPDGFVAGSFSTGKRLLAPIKVAQDIEIYPESQIVMIAGEQIELSMSEFNLLDVLAHRAGQVVKREFLTRSLRGINYDFGDRSLDMRISSLRKKLKDSRAPYRYIKTIRSVGYMLVTSEP